MNTQDIPAYGLWSLVIINSAVFIIFAFSFFKPHTKRDWRSFGAFSAFVIALFTEMYGFPLTIYILSGWLSTRYPDLNVFSHNNGHLWNTLLGLKGDPHLNTIHFLSEIMIAGGFILIAGAWRVLYNAQVDNRVAISGPYAYVRHPQYVGFIVILIGFLLQWPTLLTILMFPFLVVMYLRLARREEFETLRIFGNEYSQYAAEIPAFFPRFRTQSTSSFPHQ